MADCGLPQLLIGQAIIPVIGGIRIGVIERPELVIGKCLIRTWNEIYDDGFMLRLAHELKRKLAAAEPIVVYVNPHNGAESILIKNVIWEHMSMLLVGFGISWAALLWFVYILAFKLKYQK